MNEAILFVKERINYAVLLFSFFIIISLYVDIHFSFSQQGWMTITILAMTQFTIGTWVRQTLVRSITIILALTVSGMCQTLSVSYAAQLLSFLSLIVSFISLIYLDRKYSSELMTFALILMLTNFLPTNIAIKDQIIDVIIASAFMMIISIGVTFLSIKRSFIDLILKYVDYLTLSFDRIIHPSLNQALLPRFNEAFHKEGAWVFSHGFSPRLRAGFRYYLLQLEHIVELLSIIEKNVDYIKNDHDLYECFRKSIGVSRSLLLMVGTFFRGENAHDDESDWMKDLQVLERFIEKYFPATIHSQYMSANDLSVIGLLRACKEVRQVLLQLVIALPTSLR